MEKFKWHIKFYLKSGIMVEGVYVGEENDSNGVATKFLVCKDNTFNGLKTLSGRGSVLVNNSEVAAIELIPMLGKGQTIKKEATDDDGE